MSDIENELRRLGDKLRSGTRGYETLPVRQRRRIKVRRALFAAAGAVTAIALVASASYGLNFVREGSDIAPAEDATSTLIRFDRSGGFTGDHHVLTVKRDGSAVLESPGSSDLVEAMDFELDPDVMARLRGAVGALDWARLDERRTLTNVMVADGYLIEMSHEGYKVIVESPPETRTTRSLIHLLSGIIDQRLNDAVAGEPRLTLSEAEVRSGEVVELAIRARSDYIWGVLTALEANRDGRWRRVGYWETWTGRGPSVLEAITTRGGAIRDIGFSGSADFRLRIPQLHPGTYRITKEFISQGTAPVEERRTVARVRFEVVRDEWARSVDDFSAIWPEDSFEAADQACQWVVEDDESAGEGENGISARLDPESIVLEFGAEVLGWDEASIAKINSPDELVYRLTPTGGPPGAGVMVRPIPEPQGCWSVGSVSRLPADEPKEDRSMSVRDRDVMMGFDPGGASSAIFEVGYGGKTTRHLWTRGEQEGVEFRLDFEPSGTGHFLVLLRDEDGNVFSAFGSPLPEGDFAAG